MADYYVDPALGSDSNAGTSPGAGNAYLTPGKAMQTAIAAATAGFRIYVKGSATSTTTTDTANVAGGRLDFTLSGTQSAFNRLIGYTTTITDGGRFTFALGSGLTGPLVTTNNANSFHDIRNLNLTGNSTSGASALTHNGRSNRMANVKVSAFTGGGAHIVIINNDASLRRFEVSGGNTSNSAALIVNGSAQVSDGWVHGNAGRGVHIAANAADALIRVASCDHTGANGYGFYIDGARDFYLDHCVEWNNAAGGFVLTGTDSTVIIHKSVSGGGGGYNYDNRSAADAIVLLSPRHKANTSGLYPATPNIVEGADTLSGDPFTDYANGDFSPDSTAGEGAKLRGVSEAILGGTTTSYADVGAAQHQDAGGGGTTIIIVEDD